MKTFSHTRPVRDEAGNITGQRPAPVSRATVAALGGQFGRDHLRRLVVSLRAGDVLAFRPEGTRHEVTALAVDVYRWVIQCAANRRYLERARERKAALAAARLARRIAATDRRLRREARKEREG